MTSHSYIMSYMMHTNLNGRCQRKGCIVLRIKVSFIFRHTYVFAMEDTEVQNKILYREKTLQWYSFTCENAHRPYSDDIQCFLIRE